MYSGMIKTKDEGEVEIGKEGYALCVSFQKPPKDY